MLVTLKPYGLENYLVGKYVVVLSDENWEITTDVVVSGDKYMDEIPVHVDLCAQEIYQRTAIVMHASEREQLRRIFHGLLIERERIIRGWTTTSSSRT